MAFNIFLLAVRNLKRRPLRSLVIFLGMTALSGTLFALTALYISVNRGIEKGRARLGADAMVVPVGWQEDTKGILLSGTPSEFYMKAGVEEKLKGIKGVKETASQLFIVSAPLACCSVSDTMLIGFEPESDFTISPWVDEILKEKLSDNEVIAGTNILGGIGGRIQFYGREFVIRGKLEPTGMRFLDSSVFIPMGSARQMIADSKEKALKTLNIKPDEVSAVLVRFNEKARHEEVAVRIEYALPELKVVLSNDILRIARRNLLMPMKSVITAGVIQWAVSLFMISVLYSFSIVERTREIGLLRAMGAKGRDVRAILFYEILMLSGTAGIVGVTSGILFILSFQNLIRVAFNVPFLLPPLSQTALIALTTSLISLITGFAVTFYPVISVSRKSPFDAIRGI